jgi:hypothetical protein
MSELIISRSFKSLARCVTMRIPSEHTFSVVVRSVATGATMLEISTGTACTGLGGAEKLPEPARISTTMPL